MESPRHPLGSRLAALLVLATSVLGLGRPVERLVMPDIPWE